MNYLKILTTFLLCILAVQFGIGQDKPKSYLLDEFGKLCSEDILARIDNFTIALNNASEIKGVIISNGDRTTEGRNLYYLEWLRKQFFDRKGIDRSRIEIIRGPNGKNVRTQFWIVPADAEPPLADGNFVPLSFTGRTRFDLAEGSSDRFSKQLESSFDDLGCGFRPNLEEFAKILLSDKNLTGEIIVNNRNKREAIGVAVLIIKELTRTHKIPRSRFVLRYVHRAEFGEVELWLKPWKQSIVAGRVEMGDLLRRRTIGGLSGAAVDELARKSKLEEIDIVE